MKTNELHYLSLIYFVNEPLHVSGMFIAHHHAVFTADVQQLALVTRLSWLAAGRVRPAASHLNSGNNVSGPLCYNNSGNNVTGPLCYNNSGNNVTGLVCYNNSGNNVTGLVCYNN
jgi:hypothetical protein